MLIDLLECVLKNNICYITTADNSLEVSTLHYIIGGKSNKIYYLSTGTII